MLAILAKRLGAQDDCELTWEDSALEGIIDSADMKEVDQMQPKEQADKTVMEHYRDDSDAYKKSVSEKGANGKEGNKKAL